MTNILAPVAVADAAWISPAQRSGGYTRAYLNRMRARFANLGYSAALGLDLSARSGEAFRQLLYCSLPVVPNLRQSR